MTDNSPSRDEFLDAAEDARVALYDFIKMLEPGTGLDLHRAYNDLKRVLATAAKEDAERDQRAERDRRYAEDRERQQRWRGLPRPERLHRVLNAVGSNRLTIREIHTRLSQAHPECMLYESDVRPAVKLLHDSGELARVAESRGGSRTAIRYRYFRPTELDPRLLELERALEGGK